MQLNRAKRQDRRRRFHALEVLETRKVMTVITLDPGVEAEVLNEVQAVRASIANNGYSSSDGSSVDLSQLDAVLASLENDMSSGNDTIDEDAVSSDLDAIAAAGLDPNSIDDVDNSSSSTTPTQPDSDSGDATSTGPAAQSAPGMSPAVSAGPQAANPTPDDSDDNSDPDDSGQPHAQMTEAGDLPKIKIEITPPDTSKPGPKSGTPIPPPNSVGNVIRRIGWRIKNYDIKISIEVPVQ